jgi:hypothetical protein
MAQHDAINLSSEKAVGNCELMPSAMVAYNQLNANMAALTSQYLAVLAYKDRFLLNKLAW